MAVGFDHDYRAAVPASAITTVARRLPPPGGAASQVRARLQLHGVGLLIVKTLEDRKKFNRAGRAHRARHCRGPVPGPPRRTRASARSACSLVAPRPRTPAAGRALDQSPGDVGGLEVHRRPPRHVPDSPPRAVPGGGASASPAARAAISRATRRPVAADST